MSNLFLGFLMHLWNVIVQYQMPVTYRVVETHNRYMSHQKLDGGVTHIFEVKQLRLSRTPKKPFRGRVIYLYEVSQYVFKEGEFQNKHSSRFPEFCSFLLRNTKIPHVLAINAFLNTEVEATGGIT